MYRSGRSEWVGTFCIDTKQSDGSDKKYFLKVGTFGCGSKSYLTRVV